MKRWYIAISIIVVVIIALVVGLDPLAKKIINQKIDQSSMIRGEVKQVNVRLFEAAVQLGAIELFYDSESDSASFPLFSADSLLVDLEWKPLFRKTLVGDVSVVNPEMNYILLPSDSSQSSDTTASSQSGYPSFRVQQLEVSNGQVHVKDPTTDPPLTASITDLYITGKNISNIPDSTEQLPASLQLEGITTGNGKLVLNLDMDLLPNRPQFTSNLSIDSISLPDLNDFFEAYTGINMNGGSLSLTSELSVDSGAVDGFIEPNFTDIKVVELGSGSNAGSGIFNKGWEALAGIGLQIIQNEGGAPQESLGRIEISKKMEKDQEEQDQSPSILESIEQAVSQALDTEIGKQSESPS